MRDANEVAQDYIALWNEKDAGNRLSLFKRTWTENATYRDPLMSGRGQAEIDGLIAMIHERFPDFAFSLIGTPHGYDDVVRFSWALGPEGGEAVVKGTDIAHRDGDRIASITGFIDQAPAALAA